MQRRKVSSTHPLVGFNFFPQLIPKRNQRPERPLDFFLRKVHLFELLPLALKGFLLLLKALLGVFVLGLSPDHGGVASGL